MTYTQENRLFAIATALPDDTLLLRSFTGYEGISQLFRFDLDLLSEDESVSFESVVGKNATLRISFTDGSDRFFNGFVSRFSQGARDRHFTAYRAEIVPWLWFLTRKAGCRIFQKKKTPDILQQIFGEYGFKDFALRLYGNFVEREYCVQYRETDFNFVSRLMEEEGISYFFEHENSKHTLVLTDSAEGYKPCPKQAKVRYETSPGVEDCIRDWHVEEELRPGAYALKDYNFETPSTNLGVKLAGKNVYEIYDYPGLYGKIPDGDGLVRVRLQEMQAPCVTGRGSSDIRDFTSGYTFDVADHYRDDQNQTYLLTSVRHTGSQGAYRSDGGGAEGEYKYSNTFECIPKSTPFRPARVTPKPVVQGSQTAVVVGKGGEEIWTDKYGRVKVQFHWDREGKMDENSSCWIRVGQLWAGKQWGAVYIPRIGQEVIVDFLEGDPDRPIITGRVYNAEHMPPYELPSEQTKSTLKSDSSKGSGGFNELRFEDKKGDEQIFLHGEKNLDIRVKHDVYETIENDRHLIVKNDQIESVENNLHTKIANDSKEQIGGDRHVKVTGKEAISVGGSHSFKVSGDVIEVFQVNHSEQVGVSYYLKANQVVIEASMGMTLKCGGNNVVIDPVGVTIKGTMVTIDGSMVRIASGPGSPAMPGSAGSAVPPAAPDAAQEADKADPGEMAKLKAEQIQQQKGKYGAVKVKTLKAAGGAGGAGGDELTDEEKKKKTWIEIELFDEDNNPVPGEAYKITLPDGSVKEGTLNEKGFARVDGIDPGTCKVTFPKLDKEAWKPK